MFYVYILQSISSGKYYTGQTEDLTRRLEEHNIGQSRYTNNKDPWKLVYNEECETRTEAIFRERYLKTGAGRDWLKKNIFKSIIWVSLFAAANKPKWVHIT